MLAPVRDVRLSERLARDARAAKVICVTLRPFKPSFKRDLMNRVDSGLGGRL
jgi:hypothetical protein